jgi:hypothetical protein
MIRRPAVNAASRGGMPWQRLGVDLTLLRKARSPTCAEALGPVKR